MASGLADRAARRDEARRALVAELQGEGRWKDAFDEAIDAVRSEALKVYRRRPRDAELIYAEMTANLLDIAAQLHAHKPEGRSHG